MNSKVNQPRLLSSYSSINFCFRCFV